MVEVKAFVVNEYGPPEHHKVETIPIEGPKKGQVLVQIIAAGLNFPDVLIIQGKYQFQPPFPFSPGSEISGIVRQVGVGVTAFAVGDRVAGMLGWGGFTEMAVIDESRLFKIPESLNIDLLTAASFSMTYGTTIHAFKQRANLRPGETVLVLGASGGTGLAAVELAKVMGATVIAGASTDEKLAVCKQFGADHTINYSKDDLKRRVMEITDGNGVDVVYDPVGDKYAEPALRCLAWKGRYLVIGFSGGQIPKIPLNLPLLKGGSIVGVFWGRFAGLEPEVLKENTRELMDLVSTKKLKPLVSKQYPLNQAGQAIRDMMNRKIVGKAVILCTPPGKL